MSQTPTIDPDLWNGKRVILAVTGGIACFKAATVCSRLVQAGADVSVLMTESATRFVGPITFQSISGKPVVTSLWESHDHHDSQHIGLARSCDIMILAPATTNTIARIAAGMCDDVVTLVANALPTDKKVLLAPAMNEQMWENPVTQRNLKTLTDLLGYHTVGPGEGWQACRTKGTGRMSEPDDIVAAAQTLLASSGSLSN